jgi:signal transduction histidine kinase
LAEKKGDYKTAYAASDSFHTIKDSLLNVKFRSEVVIKQKDQELQANQKIREKETEEFASEKITFIAFILFLIVIATWLYVLLKRQRSLNKQLELQKKQIEEGLAQRSQLLSFIAHEIRNPLGGIISLTELLLNDHPTVKQRELLDYQKKASGHLLSLMNDVLDYQKLGSGKVELNNIPFNLRDVLYQVYALYQADIREKKLNYDLDYDNTIPHTLTGDPIRITQVFSNLLNNAIKFTEKGTITIATRLVKKTETEATIFCKVSDSGVGIPKEDQEKIFELYVQSSTNKPGQLGTGLGLSIVKNLLSLMDSKVELQSEPGVGTTFSFTIVLKMTK